MDRECVSGASWNPVQGIVIRILDCNQVWPATWLNSLYVYTVDI